MGEANKRNDHHGEEVNGMENQLKRRANGIEQQVVIRGSDEWRKIDPIIVWVGK